MERKLQRDETNKMLGGVASGLGEYFDIDPTWVRVIFILVAVFGGSGVLIYIILWIVVPAKPSILPPYGTDYRVYEDRPAEPPAGAPYAGRNKDGSQGKTIAGLILVAIGLYFLLNNFFIIPLWISIYKLWPLVLIVIGAIILGKSGKKREFTRSENSGPVRDPEGPKGPGDQPLA